MIFEKQFFNVKIYSPLQIRQAINNDCNVIMFKMFYNLNFPGKVDFPEIF